MLKLWMKALWWAATNYLSILEFRLTTWADYSNMKTFLSWTYLWLRISMGNLLGSVLRQPLRQ